MDILYVESVFLKLQSNATNELLDKIKDKGVELLEIYLDVGLGTFRPVQAENILEHKMHYEKYQIPEESAIRINKAKKEGRRIIAVGTTTVRTLESSNDENGVVSGSGEILTCQKSIV